MTTEPMDQQYEYDPDAPPESTFDAPYYGRLTHSVMVNPTNIMNYEDYIQKSARDYWDAAKNQRPVWYLGAEGISIVRSDGKPFRKSDILSLQDKNGKWLQRKMTPDLVATQFRGLGVTASYTQPGADNHAVGRIFKFEPHDITMRGKGAAGRPPKTVQCWPTQLMGPGWQYDGEVQVVEPKADEATNSAPQAAPTVTSEQATELLRTHLLGKPKTEMFNIIMATPQLKAVGKVFGVGLVEAATDDSLVAVLQENGVLKVNEQGVFEAV